ncbi:MAG: HupE/UreJ family protein [Acidobacteria bacterium]|nr:MAG: HupE/UreJ family protein [Acidobacteriota bacterium]REJ98984.1 MAG: HupE/UreJ family protein [Acidobacteriota bacterium]REK16296.1 MAG: HupE/UreJ family protein [Acidobacteriota bacterium]REK43977.1 MAG: HupE/UreJ family protein [Acidobacteriota bacterium]
MNQRSRSGSSSIYRVAICALLVCYALGQALYAPKKTNAHAPEQSYLYVRVYEDRLGGRFEMTTPDLNRSLDLGLRPQIPKTELDEKMPAIQKYILDNVRIGNGTENYGIRFTETGLMKNSSLGDFVTVSFELDGVKDIPESLLIEYDLLFNENPGHQGLVIIEYSWKAGIHNNESIPALVISEGDGPQSLSLTKSASMLTGFLAMIKLGIWHIWIGFDHILFLFALLLPSVLTLKKDDEFDRLEGRNEWKPTDRFRPALIKVVKIVTFFTIAHTITLSLASLEIVTLPSWLVESIIAISIALAALYNLRPMLIRKEWLIAFGFGLFHGFGFASVLADKGFAGDYLVLTLLGFNLGVEIGQVAIILVVFPLLFLLRRTPLYKHLLFWGSCLLILISLYWFVERAFGIDLPVGYWILRMLGQA